ncbi:MAG: hypothetical protein RLY14_1158, partial [Planctomycetota bacterium]
AKRCSNCGSRKPCSSTDQSNPVRTEISARQINSRFAASFEHEHEHRCAEHEHESRWRPSNPIKTQRFEAGFPNRNVVKRVSLYRAQRSGAQRSGAQRSGARAQRSGTRIAGATSPAHLRIKAIRSEPRFPPVKSTLALRRHSSTSTSTAALSTSTTPDGGRSN